MRIKRRKYCPYCGKSEKLSKLDHVRLIMVTFFATIGVMIVLLLVVSVFKPEIIIELGNKWFGILMTRSYSYSAEMKALAGSVTQHCYTNQYCIAESIYHHLLQSQEYSTYGILNEPEQTLGMNLSDCKNVALVYCNLLAIKGVPCSFVVSEEHVYNIVDIDGEKYEVDLTYGVFRKIG